jgi:hypothetical protein
MATVSLRSHRRSRTNTRRKACLPRLEAPLAAFQETDTTPQTPRGILHDGRFFATLRWAHGSSSSLTVKSRCEALTSQRGVLFTRRSFSVRQLLTSQHNYCSNPLPRSTRRESGQPLREIGPASGRHRHLEPVPDHHRSRANPRNPSNQLANLPSSVSAGLRLEPARDWADAYPPLATTALRSCAV